MLGKVARKPDQLLGERHRQTQATVGDIKTEFGHPLLRHPVAVPSPGLRRQRRHRVLRQAEHLADLSHRTARAVMNHRRGHAGALAAVFPVDVLDDLLTAVVLEINIDVRWLVALGRDEAFEQKVDLRRVDSGNPQAVADG